MALGPISVPTSLADQQWLFTKEQLERSPSRADGYSAARERHERTLAIRRLYVLKDHFGVPYLVVATAATLLHRFYTRVSLKPAAWDTLSSVAFFLASKTEENHRPLKYIIAVTLALNAGRTPVESPPKSFRYQYDDTDPNFVELRKAMLYWEEVMLRTLCFDLTVAHPNWGMMGCVGEGWKGERRQEGERVKRAAWHFLGDSLYTTMSLLYRPTVIAAAAIVCAAVQLQVSLPTAPTPPPDPASVELLARQTGEIIEVEPYWLEVLDVTPEEVKAAVEDMLGAYEGATDPFVKTEAARARTEAVALAARLQPPSPPVPPRPVPAAGQDGAAAAGEPREVVDTIMEAEPGASVAAGIVPQKRAAGEAGVGGDGEGAGPPAARPRVEVEEAREEGEITA